MIRKAAIKFLLLYRKKKIKDVYEEISEAILALRPNFEYPDWDYKTVEAFLEDYGSQHCELYW